MITRLLACQVRDITRQEIAPAQEVACTKHKVRSEIPQKVRRMSVYKTLGGRVTCSRCNAKSKRTKQQCRNPAIKGKTKCKHHGGCSTGSLSPFGRARQVAANTKYGTETRAIRAARAAKMAELKVLGKIIEKW